jgi:transposase
LAKPVVQVHGADAAGATVLRKQLRRGQVVAFSASLPRCVVGLEACATAHYWARQLQAVGHEVRLMAAQYVKAYAKRNKNDAADAAAICEAVSRPTMRFVAIKMAEQQAALLLHRGRERLVRQRTSLVNAPRAHLAEFGVIAPQGLRNVARLIAIVRDESDTRLPDLARQVLQVLVAQLEQLMAGGGGDRAAADGLAPEQPGEPAFGEHPGRWTDHRHGPCRDGCGAHRVCQRPRVCSLAGSGAAAALDRWQSPPRRHLQARQPVLAGSADQRRERQSAALENDQRRPVVIGLRRRRPSLVVAVALANKTARIAWAVMHREQS